MKSACCVSLQKCFPVTSKIWYIVSTTNYIVREARSGSCSKHCTSLFIFKMCAWYWGKSIWSKKACLIALPLQDQYCIHLSQESILKQSCIVCVACLPMRISVSWAFEQYSCVIVCTVCLPVISEASSWPSPEKQPASTGFSSWLIAGCK